VQAQHRLLGGGKLRAIVLSMGTDVLTVSVIELGPKRSDKLKRQFEPAVNAAID
jgi:hypothetical protein